MIDHKRIITTPAVWNAIWNAHNDSLIYHGSFSDPDGTAFGKDGTKAIMHTIYSLKGSDAPLIEIETTWDISPETPNQQLNKTHKYYLCLPQDD